MIFDLFVSFFFGLCLGALITFLVVKYWVGIDPEGINVDVPDGE